MPSDRVNVCLEQIGQCGTGLDTFRVKRRVILQGAHKLLVSESIQIEERFDSRFEDVADRAFLRVVGACFAGHTTNPGAKVILHERRVHLIYGVNVRAASKRYKCIPSFYSTYYPETSGRSS